MMRIFLSLLVILSLLLSACANRQDRATYHIGVSQCSGGFWREKMNDEMLREGSFYPEASVELRLAVDDADRQIADIRYFIDKKVDLIVISPLDGEKLTPIVSEAFDAGIPIVVADRMVVGNKYTAFVGGDNLAVGQEIADYLNKKLPEGGKIMEMRGKDGSSPVALRHKGLTERLAEYKKFDLVASIDCGWQGDSVAKYLRELLPQHTDVKAIVSHNDGMACYAFMTANEIIPNNDILIVGVDGVPGPGQGCQSIIAGDITASAYYPTGGDVIMQTAMQILKGEPYKRFTTLPTYMVTNKDEATLLENMYQVVQHESQTVYMLQNSIATYWKELDQERAFLLTSLAGIALLIILLILTFRSWRYKHRTNKRLEQQREELREQRNELIEMTNNLKAATNAKLNFFTNVSHDFRTPLTLIAGPVEMLNSEEGLSDKQKQLLSLVQKNTTHLLHLINQTLDLRKYESGKLELNLSGADLSELVKNWCLAFDSISHKKNIKLYQTIEQTQDKGYYTLIDVPKMERIFYNLLGNAFKFTQQNGTITVSLSRKDQNIIMEVEDNGPGISAEHINRIFENYYQIDATSSEGSGLGLALVKSFVNLHDGTIEVTAPETGTGTIFKITLPIRETQVCNTATAQVATPEPMPEIEESQNNVQEEIPEDETRPVILVIDDTADVRTYMHTLLDGKYIVRTACDGKQGLQIAERIIPDAIICDVMMPEMDGYECCRQLKNGVNTCHIPVMMLTACSLDEQRVQGHECGADAYISKPFNNNVLIAQLQALLDNHRRVQDFFSIGGVKTARSTTTDAAETPNITTMDEDLLKKVRQAIEDHMADYEYGVEQLSQDILMSRSQLFRKLKALTGYSPFELIKNARLQKARQLLQTTDENIQQICFQVGFNYPNYFSKCYKEYFGIMPSEEVRRTIKTK